MIFDVLSLLLSLPLVLATQPSHVDSKRASEQVFENTLVHVARFSCKNALPKDVDPLFLKKLLQIEKKLGIPFKYRGMVLAAACNESGYSTKVRGDRGKAVGILQMWPWWERRYKIKRTDPYASATTWLTHILRTVPKARKKCGKHRAFVSAWAWVASGPKKWKCRAPRHYTRLKRWHSAVQKEIES